jgi:hypothetical protein
MFIKYKVVFDKNIQANSNFDFFEIYYNTDEKYFFEYYQYIDSYSKPELKFTYDKNLINSLKRTYKENIIKFEENKKSERKYPSLCCIERIYKNDLYNFKVLNIWEKVW